MNDILLDTVWDILLASIERGMVIPIIGPELAVVDVGDERLTVDQYVARSLAEELGIEFGVDLDGDGRFTLNDVVAGALRLKLRPEMLYPRISRILSNPVIAPAESLRRLARITDFKLYVTLTPDMLMRDALIDAGRGKRSDIRAIGYSPNDMPNCDLPEPVRRLTYPVAYHMLGRHSPLPDFVISEEDLLESLIGLQSESSPRLLLDELESHTLLFLGGSFPDWLLRMLLRLTKRRRLSSQRATPGAIEVLADNHSRASASLMSFLNDFSPPTKILDMNADAFIDQLWLRWSAQRRGETLNARTPASVFISYTTEDAAAAIAASERLSARGVEVWLDRSRLTGGEDYWSAIQDQISTCVIFMPLISRSTERRTRDAVFRREWAVAAERSRGNSDSVKFIMPVIVDDLEIRQVVEVPPTFAEKHFRRFPGGCLDDPYIDNIAALAGAQP